MSDLKKKLDLYKFTSPPGAEERLNTEAGASDRSSASLRFGDIELVSSAPGVHVRNLHFVDCVFGSRRLHDFRPLSLSGILELALIPRQEIIHPAEVLFLDCETIGLSRGAGNHPFLTGLAYFDGEELVCEQIFLNEMSGEGAYLDLLLDRMEQRPYLVSYNGRAFDLPLIRNRLLLNRKKERPPLYHFDLLHIFRRLVKKTETGGFKQKEMEASLLGSVRQDDIDGARIPQLYFDYRKYGETAGMDAIFEHNILDIQGLCFLFLEAIRIYRERDAISPEVRRGLARIMARNRRTAEAVALLESEIDLREGSIARSVLPETKARERLDLLFLAGLYAVQKRWGNAARLYRRVADDFSCPIALLALAKIEEHRFRRHDRALELTERLLEILYGEDRGEGDDFRRSGPYAGEQLLHRRKRLEGKVT